MARNHPSLLYLLIIIVVCASHVRSGDLFDRLPFEEDDESDKAQVDDETLNFIESGRFKFRRDIGDEKDGSEMDDESIRYILEHIQRRDASGRDATAQPPSADTFNATTALNNIRPDSDLSKPAINNTFERPAASSVTNGKTGELANVIAMLEQMREQLELMRMSKSSCNATPDGSNCDVNGYWNSEQIGLRLELAHSMADNKLSVKLTEKEMKKVANADIDSTWTCSGTAFHSIGGPIYFHCRKPPMETIAIFQGMCKVCSGYQTIFGQWHFQRNPRDCRQVWTFIESKNDIFRKDVLQHKSSHQPNGDIHNTLEKSANVTGISNKFGMGKKVRRNIKRNPNHHKLTR